MAEENNTVLDNPAQDGGAAGGTTPPNTTPPATEPEKKYTDDDVNNISKKNSEKAVNKLLKELGITDKEKAKKILAEAAAAEGASQSVGQDDTRVAELTANLEASVLENIMLSQHFKAEKVARAVKLINRADCLDDEGNFSRDKATEAVKKLSEDWSELAETADGKHVGFSIGGDGQQNTAPAGAAKPVKQKSWNRFN